jgi:alpha-tubulin suppressor-like RCC1 family protein
VNRRNALKLLATVPFAVRLDAQTRAAPQHRLALAQTHGFLFEPNGGLMVWGSDPGASVDTRSPAPDRFGLGHSDPVDAYTLYSIGGVRNVVAAAAGAGSSFAVLADGRILAWGATGSGDLGITPRAEFEERAQPRLRTNTPTQVAVGFDAVDVSCKSDHVLALARDGSVYAWGRGDSGQLGIGSLPEVAFKTRSARVMPYVPYPVRLPDLEGVGAIGAGDNHSLALLKDGTVRAWGSNRYGQIGDGTRTNRDRPTVVPGVRNAVAVAAGGHRSAALLADGTVMEWGANHVNLTPRLVPALVPGARGIRSVVAGGEHVAAITRTGEVMTWGQDAHYQIGRRGDPHSAGVVRGLAGVTFLAAGAGTTIAVLESGRMMTWGEVRPWTRPDVGQGGNLSPFPILLWLDGLDQP